MPSKKQTVIALASEEIRATMSSPSRYMDFLDTAAQNYKYNYREQVLIHAQKPDATACADIETWNRLGRWVNKGTKGIALLVDNPPVSLRYVFDISDTNSRAGREVSLWELKPRYETSVMESLENAYGELNAGGFFPNVAMAVAERMVEDNLPDYLELLKEQTEGSLLEELDEDSLRQWLREPLQASVSYMILARCGYAPRDFYGAEDFAHIMDFDTEDTASVLGDAASRMAEGVLREIATTVRSLQKAERAENRTFAEPAKEKYNDAGTKNTERSKEHGTDLQAGGRLFDSRLGAAGEPEGGQVRDAAADLPAGASQPDLHGDAVQRQAEFASGGNRPAGQRDAGSPDLTDEEGAGRDRSDEGGESAPVGTEDEQYPQRSGGDRSHGTDLQLSGRNGDLRWEAEYFHQDEEKNELLRTCEKLNNHRMEIAAFFASQPDEKERGNFVKSFFDNTFIEQILESGQRVGCRAYDDLLHLWRGSYLSREREEYLLWPSVARRIEGMILMNQWLAPGEVVFPTEQQQKEQILYAKTKTGIGFALPQAAVDYVLTHGTGVEHGKFGVYKFFIQKKTPIDNIRFLKEAYGIGGQSDAIPGTGLWEDHDGKGISISRLHAGEKASVLLSWSMVEKRIRELIAADRYLTKAEKAEYPKYLANQRARQERGAVADEIKSIITDYNDFQTQLGNKDAVLNQYVLFSCASSLCIGEKTTWTLTKDNYVLPLLREALQTIIAEKTHLTERAESALEKLSMPLFAPLEPTYDELNPPPEPPKEYRLSLGDTIFLGTHEYDVLSLGEQTVVLYDTEFPIFNQEMPTAEFYEKLAENPLNDKYLQPVEPLTASSPTPAEETANEAEQEEPTDVELGQSAAENGEVIAVPNTEAMTEEEPLSAPPMLPKRKAAPNILHPEITNRRNHRILGDDLGVGTPSERYSRNVMAIRLLKKLEAEERLATELEQDILADYVGWGGLADCFDQRNSHYSELKDLLTEEEYAAARESTLTAFFTPPVVIKAMYQALANMGFQTGNILEPSCGVGNFMGLLPESMSSSKMYGIELDSISGRIAQQLYQHNSIAVQGFEKTDLPDSFFDAAIGNVPFGQFKVSDRRYDKHNFLIHDYFFARTLDKVRPGGVIAFITSKGTMDKENPSVRKYIAQRADLIAAIRLPNNTFKEAAGTEVTSDILILQKRESLIDMEPDWVHLGVDANGIKMNQYFVDHPDMIMGEMQMVSGPYGPESACIPYEGQELSDLLADAVAGIHGQITEYDVQDVSDDEEDHSIPADPTVRNFSFALVDGKVYFRENSRMNPVELTVTAEGRVKGMIAIRDCVRQLIEYQTEDYPDSRIEAEQEKLNALYDEFEKKYGRINSRANNSAFRDDSSYYLLTSLEVTDDEGKFIRKADMFTKRTIRKKVIVTTVDTASEALALSLAEKAGIDMPYMQSLTGKTEEQLAEDLRGVIFLNPEHIYENDSHPKYLPADEYLSGNVREKLALARRTAELYPEDYAPNVAALERVQPQDLTASEISVRLGATWLPEDVITDFMFEQLSTPRYARWNIKVHYSPITGEWNIEGKNYDRGNVKANSTYGTERINAYKIMEETLNLRDVRIFDYLEDGYGKKIAVLNKKETAIAQGKQELLKQAFQDWIWSDPERRARLTTLYNEKFNSNRPREYDGSHLNFVGMNPEIRLRPHQVNAVAHILYGGNTLLAHVVGAGKTYEMTAAAMESKRLGLCQKSLFVVPNHLTEQWASEFLQLYPAANILVATRKDFEAKNRKRFCSRIATGDYDAVIIGHSQFEKIPISIQRQQALLQQQLDEIMDGIADLRRNRGDRFSIKQMEKSKKSIQAKLDKLNDQTRKDDVVTFEQLGIDRIFVDEAHFYKNLAAFSKMRNVGGISQTEAMKSSDLYMKCRYLDELTGGRGVIFATGTPISNSMVEMYTMQKYLQYDTLRRNGLLHFDAWASTFGETVTAIELAPEGTGYRAKTRFSRFYNLPELMCMFKEVADVQTADMLKLPVPEAHYHNVVLKPSEHQKEMVASLSDRAEKVRAKMVNSSEDNMLLITNDGRKLALDQRLVNPMLPDSDTGKVKACANNVYDIWQRTTPQRSTQMVFCDLSTPHNDGKFNVYDALRDKLMEMGIPKEEIAYIHSASTEAAKKELFGKVRSGQIRVLIGSTQKMGAGTNVQQKLIALHHLDCPWRPSDLQQREGRIIRQGNENPEVDIYTYVTEGTFDSYLYQLVESKQKFIGQIMTSKCPVRSAEDIDETALSYAEIKALCTGNPLIKEKMDLDIDVGKLKLLKASHLSQRYALEDQLIREFPQKITALEQRISGLEQDIAHLAAYSVPNAEGFCPMTVEGKTYTDKKAAGSAILEFCHNMKNPATVPLGSYRGFDMKIGFDTVSHEYKITLGHELCYTTPLGTDLFGNILRLDNTLAALPAQLEACREQLENVQVQMENAKAEIAKPFPGEEELQSKTARLDELNILLNMDKADNEIVDGEPEEEQPERAEKSQER